MSMLMPSEKSDSFDKTETKIDSLSIMSQLKSCNSSACSIDSLCLSCQAKDKNDLLSQPNISMSQPNISISQPTISTSQPNVSILPPSTQTKQSRVDAKLRSVNCKLIQYGSATDVTYECHCGNQRHSAVRAILNEKWSGCADCGRKKAKEDRKSVV